MNYSKAKAFLDTTVLTDCLLSPNRKGLSARLALKSFEQILVPEYAIKEFKAGPLRVYVWLHNKTVANMNWSDVIMGVAMVLRQKNLASTAIQAIADFESSIAKTMLPPGAARNDFTKREAEIWLKSKIIRAWKKRSRSPFQLVNRLPCYANVDLRVLPTRSIDNKPTECTLGPCCLHQQFRTRMADTRALGAACKAIQKIEVTRRREVLRKITLRSHNFIVENECRRIGDAVFALQCPLDAVVLTTNICDHVPLCSSVGRSVRHPGAPEEDLEG